MEEIISMDDNNKFLKRMPEDVKKMLLTGKHELIDSVETDKYKFQRSVSVGRSLDYIKRTVIGRFTDYEEFQEFYNPADLNHFLETETMGRIVGLTTESWDYLDSNEEILGLMYDKSIQAYKDVKRYSQNLDSIPGTEKEKLASECINTSNQLKKIFAELQDLHSERYERVGERYDQLRTMNPEKCLIDNLADLHHEFDDFLYRDREGKYPTPESFREGVAAIVENTKTQNPDMIEYSENKDVKIAGEKYYYM